MSRDWKYREGDHSFYEWVRSPMQRIVCNPGKPPYMEAMVVRVRKYEDGTVTETEMPNVQLAMDQLDGDDLKDAVEMQSILIRLLAKRIDPSALEG